MDWFYRILTKLVTSNFTNKKDQETVLSGVCASLALASRLGLDSCENIEFTHTSILIKELALSFNEESESTLMDKLREFDLYFKGLMLNHSFEQGGNYLNHKQIIKLGYTKFRASTEGNPSLAKELALGEDSAINNEKIHLALNKMFESNLAYFSSNNHYLSLEVKLSILSHFHHYLSNIAPKNRNQTICPNKTKRFFWGLCALFFKLEETVIAFKETDRESEETDQEQEEIDKEREKTFQQFEEAYLASLEESYQRSEETDQELEEIYQTSQEKSQALSETSQSRGIRKGYFPMSQLLYPYLPMAVPFFQTQVIDEKSKKMRIEDKKQETPEQFQQRDIIEHRMATVSVLKQIEIETLVTLDYKLEPDLDSLGVFIQDHFHQQTITSFLTEIKYESSETIYNPSLEHINKILEIIVPANSITSLFISQLKGWLAMSSLSQHLPEHDKQVAVIIQLIANALEPSIQSKESVLDNIKQTITQAKPDQELIKNIIHCFKANAVFYHNQIHLLRFLLNILTELKTSLLNENKEDLFYSTIGDSIQNFSKTVSVQLNKIVKLNSLIENLDALVLAMLNSNNTNSEQAYNSVIDCISNILDIIILTHDTLVNSVAKLEDSLAKRPLNRQMSEHDKQLVIITHLFANAFEFSIKSKEDELSHIETTAIKAKPNTKLISAIVENFKLKAIFNEYRINMCHCLIKMLIRHQKHLSDVHKNNFEWFELVDSIEEVNQKMAGQLAKIKKLTPLIEKLIKPIHNIYCSKEITVETSCQKEFNERLTRAFTEQASPGAQGQRGSQILEPLSAKASEPMRENIMSEENVVESSWEKEFHESLVKVFAREDAHLNRFFNSAKERQPNNQFGEGKTTVEYQFKS